jgi:hypothetical protein
LAAMSLEQQLRHQQRAHYGQSSHMGSCHPLAMWATRANDATILKCQLQLQA